MLITLAPAASAEVNSNASPQGARDLSSLSEYDVPAEIAAFKERKECWEKLDIYMDWTIGMMVDDSWQPVRWAETPEEFFLQHLPIDGPSIAGPAFLKEHNDSLPEVDVTSLSDAQRDQLWREYSRISPSESGFGESDEIFIAAFGSEGAISEYYNSDGSVKSFEPGEYPASKYDGKIDSQDLQFCMAEKSAMPYKLIHSYQLIWSRFSRLEG